MNVPSVVLDIDLALRGQGLRAGSRPGGHVLAAARAAVELASDLVDPRFVAVAVSISARTPSAVRCGSTMLAGETIAEALQGAERVVAVVCTIGPALEARVSSLLRNDLPLALALDGLGSAACERFATAVLAEFEREAEGGRNRMTGPLAPGMIGWPLPDAQRQLFGLVDPSPLGVTLGSSGQMTPRKTLSFLAGVGPCVRAGTSSCVRCGAHDRCSVRTDHA